MARQRTLQQYVEALRQTRGYKSQAARLLDVTPAAITDRVKRSPMLRDLLADLETARTTARLDLAENSLDKALNAGERWAVKYTLDKLGEPRGFGERVRGRLELTGENGGPIKVVELPAVAVDEAAWLKDYCGQGQEAAPPGP